MDPLSITLAAISLVTAVKDLVELGQKIQESFEKVSKNFRDAQRVADDIQEMLEEIRVFCEDHKDALDSMKDFHVALQGLLAKFRIFERSILPLLPKAGGRKRDRLLRSWDAWRNNNKVEASILELQSDIVKIIRRYMMKSAMRNEVKLETIHQETSRGLEVLDVVRRDVSALRMTPATTPMTLCSDDSSGTTSEEFNRNVIMFANSTSSTSSPMLRTPNVITEELMTAAYIKLQINNIAMTFDKISKPIPGSISVKKFQHSWIIHHKSMPVMNLRHHIVRQVTIIRDILDAPSIHTVSMMDGCNALNRLSVVLAGLGMGRESILVGNWAIMLARTLFDTFGDGQPDLAAYLALYLLNQWSRYPYSDKSRRSQAIEEAYTTIQKLWNQSGQEARFQTLYCSILLEYTYSLDDQRSIEMTVKVIQILEVILNIPDQTFTWSILHKQFERVAQPNSSFWDCFFSSAPSVPLIRCYAQALERLGCLFRNRQPESGRDLQLLGVAVRRKLVSIHGRVYKAGLADALVSTVKCASAGHIPAKQLLNMAEECIRLLRELADKNPPHYARRLADVLWVKARTLEKLNRGGEAIAAWEEVASLAQQIVQDTKLYASALHNLTLQFRRLKRHNDAVRTGTLAISTYKHGAAETQAPKYFNLSEDLRALRRYKESAEAARTSVPLYRRLAMSDPCKWKSHLSAALANLAQCVAILGDNSEALIAWEESVLMVDSFLSTNTSRSLPDLDKYYTTLFIYPWISLILENKEEYLKVSSSAVQHLHRLSELYPQKKYIVNRLFWSQSCHAYNILRAGRLPDAQQYITHWFDIWSSKPASMSESELYACHARMANWKVEALDAQGSIEQALLATKKIHDIIKPSVGTYQPCFYWMIKSTVHEAQLQVNLGNNEEGLRVAERALMLSEKNKARSTLRGRVFSLRTVALTSVLCRNFQRAIEAATEGRSICAGQVWQDIVWEHDIFIPPSLLAILSSAEANLGRYSTAIEYAHDAVNASLEIRDRKWDISVTPAEGSYMETRGNLADILLVTGDLAQARQICEERKDYFAARVEDRMGDYRELAPILRMLGVLCCSEGRHEEGDASAKELSRIVQTLGSAFPSLQEQVKIRLRNQAAMPILKILGDMTQKLGCGHQAEVVSLFAI